MKELIAPTIVEMEVLGQIAAEREPVKKLFRFYCTIGKNTNVFSFECENPRCTQGAEDPYYPFCKFCGGHVAPKHVGSLSRKAIGNGLCAINENQQSKELEVNGTKQLVYI